MFKSDYYEKIPLSKILGKCYVMFVKDYYKLAPQGFEDKDVWVCESKYLSKNKAFKKMKVRSRPVLYPCVYDVAVYHFFSCFLRIHPL